MKLTIDNTKTTDWAEWFAWHPVVVAMQGKYHIVWLEKVERKLYSGSYIYRPTRDKYDTWK